MHGLTQLRDMYQRTWTFIKQSHQPSRNASASSSSAAPTPAPTPGRQQDQFVLMAQKNAGLRVEDLKPPPMKHRRTASGQSPSVSLQRLDTESPKTPQTDAESPPKGGARGKAPAKPRGLKEFPGSLKEGIKEPLVAAPVVAEEAFSNKRKRELEEAEQDPDAFIERTLRGLQQPLTRSALLEDLTSHLPVDFDPIIPPVQPSSKPLSFSALPPHPFPFDTLAHPQPLPSPAFDFDFFIDPTAAGFDDPPVQTPDLDAPTPYTGGTKEEASPPSDDESTTMQSALARSSAYRGAETMLADFGPQTGSGEGGVEDYEKWFAEQGVEGLPMGFAWEGELPRGVWSIYGEGEGV